MYTVHMCVCTPSTPLQNTKAREGIEFPETGIAGSCEPPNNVLGTERRSSRGVARVLNH